MNIKHVCETDALGNTLDNDYIMYAEQYRDSGGGVSIYYWYNDHRMDLEISEHTVALWTLKPKHNA
jgi:hypothetical protein